MKISMKYLTPLQRAALVGRCALLGAVIGAGIGSLGSALFYAALFGDLKLNVFWVAGSAILCAVATLVELRNRLAEHAATDG